MDLASYLVMGFGLLLLYGLIAANLRGIRLSSRKAPRNPLQGRDFTPTQTLYSADGVTGLAFDRHRKKLRLSYTLGGIPAVRTLDYQDLLACEIVENGRTIAKTRRSQAIAKPTLGRLPQLGAVSAHLADLGEDRVQRLDLRLILNDPARPQHTLTLLDYVTRRGGASHAQADHDARHWYSLLKVLIHQADQREAPLPSMMPATDGGD